MGILNVTPDSFSDRGKFFDHNAALARALEMEHEGADIIDIGGESTRPGAEPVPEQEELDRVIPVIEMLRKKRLRIPISVDTYKSVVAERALKAGAEIVNDVSGLRFDSRLAQVVRTHRAALVLMHSRGTPQTMQQLPPVRNIMRSIRESLSSSLRRAFAAGIAKQSVIIDPGIGFGKTVEQNFEILRELHRLSKFNLPILVGPSRKSFLKGVVIAPSPIDLVATVSDFLAVGSSQEKPTARKSLTVVTAVSNKLARVAHETEIVTATEVAVCAAIWGGAHIIRVHDVKEIVRIAKIADRFIQ